MPSPYYPFMSLFFPSRAKEAKTKNKITPDLRLSLGTTVFNTHEKLETIVIQNLVVGAGGVNNVYHGLCKNGEFSHIPFVVCG